MSREMTQKDLILMYLAVEGSITTMEAFSRLGITKLTTRISELRKDGYTIQGETIVDKNINGKTIRYNRYTLVDNKYILIK